VKIQDLDGKLDIGHVELGKNKIIMKNELIQESIRLRKLAGLVINEDATDDKAAEEVKDLITKVSNYEEFVAKLGTLASDKKVQAFITSGRTDGDQTDDLLKAVSKAIKVTDLRPTQNEIDVNGSLKWPLTKADSLANCLGNNTVTIKAPIVTYNGEYIIDGHHRWSQLYAMNSRGVIDAIDLVGPKINPVDVLKIVQLAIAAELGKVPTQSVQGQNLLKADAKFVREYVIKNITPECIDVFKRFRSKVANVNKAEGIADGIVVPNINSMQKTSQPVAGAPKRDVMPQTDDAVNAMKNISKGVVNYNEPYIQEESVNKKLDNMLKKSIIKIK
jgi:hypothetical protein